MKSIRTKITLLNIFGVAIGIIISTTIGGILIAKQGHNNSEHSLSLLCETGKSNLNNYFKSVEQSTKTVSSLINAHLDTIEPSEFNTKLPAHMNEARTFFNEAAKNTAGVLTYYYRVDPTITEATGEKGFWYVLDEDGKTFVSHEVADISDDKNECVWFWAPKENGHPLWLSPYVTDTIEEFVISYNVPVYRNEDFVGVVGIEISYMTLGQQIDRIKVGKTGYSWIVEKDTGVIIYHPLIDLYKLPKESRPVVPSGIYNGLKNNEHHIEFVYEGVEKHGYWMDLSNNMAIIVAIPLSEVSETWINFVIQTVVIAAVLIVLFIIATIIVTKSITKPLKELTIAAERINEGDYSVQLDYKGNDEIGVLTTTVNHLIRHLGAYINDLNNLAYDDALTSVHNKSAFDLAMKELQERLDNKEDVKFALGVFDCDDLKTINDKYGHDKGNVYLKNSCHLIVRVFEHSDVYRIGGDEFVVILKDEDYKNREKLKKLFFEKSKEICSFAKNEWEEIHVSTGIATYDPELDKNVDDVMIHADHLMYDNKRTRKKNRTKK